MERVGEWAKGRRKDGEMSGEFESFEVLKISSLEILNIEKRLTLYNFWGKRVNGSIFLKLYKQSQRHSLIRGLFVSKIRQPRFRQETDKLTLGIMFQNYHNPFISSR